MKYKKLKRVLLVSSALLLSAPAAVAITVTDYPAGAAANGITASRHNMGAMGRVLHTHNTYEICVFCHTPHHTNASLPQAPLWNRVNSATYTAYGTTLGGTNISSVGPVSLACLSCHDGLTTFDTLVNAPGSGGVTPGGTDQQWPFVMAALFFYGGGGPFVELDHFGSSLCSDCHSGVKGYQMNVGRLNVGTSLANDHPVSISYSEAYNNNVANLRPATTIISSIDLTSGLAASALSAFTGNLSQNRWAVKGYISNTATIEDLLKDGKVECSSCHDPHFRNLSWDEAEKTWVNPDVGFTKWCGNTPENCTDGQFLRRVGGNTGSAVCRTCHNK